MIKQPSESELVSKGLALLAGQYGSMVISIFFTFWLARLLGPSDFGRFALGVFSLDIFNALTDWGWEQGVFVADHGSQDRAYATLFVVRGVLGSLPFVFLCCLLAYKPSLVSVSSHHIMLMLAFAFWCEKISLTYKAILERAYALKRLAVLETAALVVSFSFAVIAVYLGYGVFALVLQRLLEKVFTLIGYAAVSPWRLGLDFDIHLLRHWITSFGFATWTGGLLGLFLYDFIGALVGLGSGVHSGGLYARSFKMATLPLMVTAVFNRITTSLYAHAGGDLEMIKQIFLKAQIVKAVLLIPVQGFLIVPAPWWIPLVLGEQWLGAVALYQLLACYGFVRAFYDDVPAVFVYGLRYPWIFIQQHLTQVCAMLAGWILAKNFFADAVLGSLVMFIGMLCATTVLWVRVFVRLSINLKVVVAALRDILVAAVTLCARCWEFLLVAKKHDLQKKNSSDWGTIFKP